MDLNRQHDNKRKCLIAKILEVLWLSSPGDSDSERETRRIMLIFCFGTSSWTRIVGLPLLDLRNAIDKLDFHAEYFIENRRTILIHDLEALVAILLDTNSKSWMRKLLRMRDLDFHRLTTRQLAAKLFVLRGTEIEVACA